jgi:ABC-2 type transport system ATP-binding protein
LEGSRGLYWRLNPIENFQYFSGNWGIPQGKDFNNQVNYLLKMLDLYKDRSRPISEFSRGMKQKTSIALALLSDPHVLLLDEPTLGLDIVTTNTIIDFLHQNSKTLGKIIIVTTHDLKLAQMISDRVAIFKEGNLVAYYSINNLSKMWETSWYEVIVISEILIEELGKFNQILISKDFCKETRETSLFFEITNIKDFYLIIEKLKHLN